VLVGRVVGRVVLRVYSRALKVHLDTLMRLLPADRVTITPVSRAFPSPDQPKTRGRGGSKQN
jgi:hypothetical protein